jgi:hypothetical protein
MQRKIQPEFVKTLSLGFASYLVKTSVVQLLLLKTIFCCGFLDLSNLLFLRLPKTNKN